jgi:hypothetical protein
MHAQERLTLHTSAATAFPTSGSVAVATSAHEMLLPGVGMPSSSCACVATSSAQASGSLHSFTNLRK